MNSTNAYNLSNTSEQIYGWISKIVEELSQNETSLLLKIYILAFLCFDFRKKQVEEIQLLKKIRTKIVNRVDANLNECDGVMLLIFCVIERKMFGGMLPVLRDYASIVSTAIKEVSPTDTIPSYQAARILLYRLDLLPKPLPVNLTLSTDIFSLLTGSEEDGLEIVRKIDFITCYGKYTVESPNGLDIVIESIMMNCLQQYKLEKACNFLRVLSYLGREDSLAIRTAQQFIFTNQEFEGGFGFFDKQIKLLSSKVPEQQARLQIKIPISLTCLWTLAESRLTNYRLFWDIGKEYGSNQQQF